MKRRAFALVAAAAATATSAACGSNESPEAVDDEAGWAIDRIIVQAAAAGTSDQQMAILEQARETGIVPFGVYNEAIDRALRCIREAGGRVEDRGLREDQGVLVRNYSVGAESEAADPVEFLPGVTVHRCIAEHSIWVEAAYGNQPSSVEAEDAHWEQFRDAIVACLQAEGIDVAGDEPIDELRELAVRAYHVDEVIQADCTAEVFAEGAPGG